MIKKNAAEMFSSVFLYLTQKRQESELLPLQKQYDF